MVGKTYSNLSLLFLNIKPFPDKKIIAQILVDCNVELGTFRCNNVYLVYYLL
jgi:hypothetical protein